ncbi:glycoside hydrolase family 88 protein [uncultured Bacteroides sp.]|uniref:glycoside hydrolase family 88 protein n=1 Tax=uncultured Bacteroides sp. TaxID=162156 RepID=UPI00262D6854|nr:glycoside hydrolase family 88 protein [uncultured Bacteroides sp.]
MKSVVERGLQRSAEQSLLMASSLENVEGKLPKSIKDGKLETSGYQWWCSGFFPGVLWYLYEYNPTAEMKKYAEMYTQRVEKAQFVTDNHDVGFMINCSYGNGYRLTGNKVYENTMIQAAKSLSTRYKPNVGLIRSWDFNKKIWQYPVIIDNMMNLELLMKVGKMVNDSTYINIALSHADNTMKNHFRPDYSCYHVVSYDTITGQPHIKQTHQGYADDSSWARGQAWAIYGYTMMYKESGKKDYLIQANNIAKYLMRHPKMPADKVPYWDFDCPDIPNTPRDASAAAIMASALIDLSQLNHDDFGNKCLAYAEDQIRSLTSPEYLAEKGTNCNFILKHSTGHKPGNSEVDVPLSYADYYYVEALMRLKNLYNK